MIVSKLSNKSFREGMVKYFRWMFRKLGHDFTSVCLAVSESLQAYTFVCHHHTIKTGAFAENDQFSAC